MHRISDNLQDRHPYQDAQFTEAYDETEVHRAFGSRAIAKYAELLVIENLPDEDRVRALRDLQELLSNQEIKSQAVERELIFTCVDLIESSSVDVRVHAAAVISSVVVYENERSDDLAMETMLRAATVLLKDPEEDAVIAAASIFRNLTISNEGALRVANHDESMATLTGMLTTAKPLSSLPQRVLSIVLQVVANITRIFEGAASCADRFITVPVLTVLKKCALYDAKTVQSAVLIVGNAAAHDQGKRVMIREQGVEITLTVLSKVLHAQPTFQKCDYNTHIELTRCLSSALLMLSTVEEAKSHLVEFGVEPLVLCLGHTDKAIKHNAMVTIVSACESPLGVAAFTNKLLPSCDLLVEVLGARCVPALLPFLRDPDEESKLQALKVLQELSQDLAGAKEFVQCLGMLDMLAELVASDGAAEIAQSAVDILQTLAKHGGSYTQRIGKKLIKQGTSLYDFEVIIGQEMATFTSQY